MADNELGTPTPSVETISERVEKLEVDVASLMSTASVPGSDVIYRPPLWSQNSAYSAADDRRLIYSTFWGGVIDLNDLRVTPRQEGANMSVDVLPGHVMIPGTEQVDQGSYLCPLAQRINVPLAAGPSAGNMRSDMIIARVYEPIDDEAYWQVEPWSSNIVPVGPAPTWDFPPVPPSCAFLAYIASITNTTTQITSGMIQDYRHLARPAPTGACILEQVNVGQVTVGDPQTVAWGDVSIAVPPYGQPLDIELRIEGTFLSSGAVAASGNMHLQLWVGSLAGGPQFMSPFIDLYADDWSDLSYFSRSLVESHVECEWPAMIRGRVVVSRTSNGWPQWRDGLLTLRISPGGSALSW